MFTIEIKGDRELVERLNAMPSTVRVVLRRKVYMLALLLEAMVKEKLSGPVLNVVSGALRRSITEEVTDNPEQISAKVYSSGDVKYAAIHEYGGVIHIPEIVPVKAKALHFFRGKAHFRWVDLWRNVQDCGPSALPIITLISLLVGLILAFVGSVQLSLFGAQLYIADLVGLGMSREMGGLMTAVIMSGRTGAAYAAQLGTMQVNNEIDALETMGFDPMEFLVLPRVLALIFVMPLLCLYADLMGIIGGALVTVNFFEVSLVEYINRTINAIHMLDLSVGVFKCAVFGVLIALSGCMRGMQCGRSASEVGDATTSAVVTGIVFIVIADSLMTIICNRLGI